MPRLEEWATYATWNTRLAEEFFGGRYGGMPVYIDLEDDVLARVANGMGLAEDADAAQALIDAVVPTLAVDERATLFGSHVRRMIRWRRDGQDTPPPMVAVLALQSMVAERMRRDEDFSASNYYGRFLQTIGRDPADKHARSKLLRGFGYESAAMWATLNRWIADDTSTRGIPTAYSFDYRVRVGIPMSQALVRESDRQVLRSLFADLALGPGQTVAVEDMARLLRACLPDSRVSSSLKLLCRDEAAVMRVAAIACIELSAWSGSVDQAAPSSRRSIALTARLRRLPRRALSLGVAIRIADAVGTLRVDADADEAGGAAFSDPIELGAADDEGWRPVVSEVSLADLLVGRARLVGDGVRAVRDPRTVLILAHNQETGRFRETDRIRLRAQHLLLAVRPARARIEAELERIARAGYTVLDALPGLPTGWVLFESVEIIAISETSAPDLAVLIPLAWTELAAAEGFRLPGRGTWHTLSPPEIRASAPPHRPLLLTVFPETVEASGSGEEHVDEAADAASSEQEPRLAPIVIERFEDAFTLDLSSIELEDGDYRVELRDARQDEVLQSTMLVHLRSSTSPEPPIRGPVLAYSPDQPLGAISARPIHNEEGNQLDDPTTSQRLPVDAADGDIGEPMHAGDYELEELEQPKGAEPRTRDVPACFVTGAHYFQLESRPRGRRWEQTFEGVCKYCGLERRFPARPASAQRTRSRLPAGRLSAAARGHAPPQSAGRSSLDQDLLFDALCFVRAGTGNAFQRMIGQLDDQPWATAETARRLMSLGHLDIELDDRLRLLRWSVPGPRLIASPAGAFLAGWRSPAVAHHLDRAVTERGGRVEWTTQEDGPARIGLLDVEQDELPELADELARRCAVPLVFEPNPAGELAEALPGLPVLRGQLPVVSSIPAGVPLQRLDGDSLEWVPAHDISLPGAYRTTAHPRLRLHFNGVDLRRVDSRLAKWLTWPRAPLLAVDESGRAVICHLGSEPPWLYERALVLRTGLLPTRREGHLVQYQGVPSGAARFLSQLLDPVVVPP